MVQTWSSEEMIGMPAAFATAASCGPVEPSGGTMMIPSTFRAIALRTAATAWVLSMPTFTGMMVTLPSWLAACWAPVISSTK